MSSPADVPALLARLRARRPELEVAIFARFGEAGYEPVWDGDVGYADGLRMAVAAAVDFGLTGMERGEEWPAPIPSATVEQAHRAARGGVSLGTVLSRYATGHNLLMEMVIAEADGLTNGPLQDVVRTQGLLLERLMNAVAVEYRRESERLRRSPAHRRAERVRALLVGACDVAELDYEIVEAWHIGVIATGARAKEAVRNLAARADRRLLSVDHGERTECGWLGGRQALASGEVARLLTGGDPAGVSFAVGEPGHGLEGWRLTHLQAQAALRVALRSECGLTRYADVALLAAALHDDVLARSLQRLYLAPLSRRRDGGAVLRETLRAYFAAGRNSSSAARALELNRRTVSERLGTIAHLLGRPLHDCLAELEVALRLEELLVGRQ